MQDFVHQPYYNTFLRTWQTTSEGEPGITGGGVFADLDTKTHRLLEGVRRNRSSPTTQPPNFLHFFLYFLTL